VPEELALFGDDDIDGAGATAIPLTTVRQPSLLIGRTAVDLLHELVADGSGPLQPRDVVFDPELVVRASSSASPPTRQKE